MPRVIHTIAYFYFISRLINFSKYREFGALSIAIAFCLRSIQMYIYWSTTWFYLLATLAGLYALHFWSSELASQKICAVFLLVLALTTYPPAALFFFAVIAVTNNTNDSKNYKFFAEAVQGVILFLIFGLVSILVIIVTIQMANISPNRRVKIMNLSAIPEKSVG